MTAPDPAEIPKVVDLASREVARYLESIAERNVRDPRAEEVAASFRGELPEDGVGAERALEELVAGIDGAVHSAGPKFFHFVDGGVTPAALGADWLASALDQNTGAWVSSPLGGELERIALGWLRDLFELPAEWSGVLTTGATMANFVALACARRWCGLRQGVDVDDAGLSGLPPIHVFGSGYVHPSDVKALGMLGIGSAGEVNAGDSDPIATMADLAERYGAWFHVDGAFGLFAALSERTRHLVEGIDRADSVSADGHRWRNVPYGCGFAFVKDASLQPSVFGEGAAYLPALDDPKPNWGYLGPEMSRRCRAFAVWATLRAYGRNGHREIVERSLDLAERLAATVDEAEDLERLAEVPLNIVCFRAHPPEVSEDRLH